MKRILSLMIVFAMVISLAACTNSDISLYEAKQNMQKVNAIETNTDISFNLEGEGLEFREAAILNQVATFLNNMKLNMKTRAIGNDENTKVQSESQLNVDIKSAFLNMEIPLKMWSDVDLDSSDIRTIINIPQEILGDLAGIASLEEDMENPLAGKDYIVYDIKKMMEDQDREIDYKKMIEFQQEFQPKLIRFMEDIEEDLKVDSDIIQLKEEKEVDGEKVKIYKVNLNNETLRELVRDSVYHILENETAKEFIVDYRNEYMDTMKDMGMTGGSSEEELEDIKEDVDEDIEKIKKEFDLFMEKMEDVKILGEEGINVLYTVDEDGYIIKEDGVMDFSLDLSELAKLEETKSQGKDLNQSGINYQAPEMKGKINFKINYTTENKNINNKDLKIKMPDLTPENSIKAKKSQGDRNLGSFA